MVSGQALIEVRESPYQDAARMLDAMVGFLGKNRMTAYLAMMAVRLAELHRVLKDTGSLYLHCDPTASHYLKLLLDAVFGVRNFRREIVWRSGWVSGFKTRTQNWIRNHDTLFFYHKDHAADWTFNKQYIPHDEDYERRGGGENPKGKAIDSVWDDPKLYSPNIKSFSTEKLGYPTQKPVALLERIIAASSNPGDLVLDPFCGCGTTVHAAEKLNRRWCGIDITHLAIGLIETRLFDAFGDEAGYTVHGVPADIDGARDFFDRDDRTKKEFEKWAVSLLRGYAQAGGKKGADGGVDGIFRFGRDREHTAIISVKGGRAIGVPMIRELDAVVEARKAQIGIFLTLHPPTQPMRDWAARAGTFQVEGFAPVPRLQIVTIEDAMERGVRAVDTPLRHGSDLKKAVREKDKTA